MTLSLDDVLLESEDKMEKTLEHLQQGLSGLRTGKASTALVDQVTVDYYGSQTRLNQMALLSTPEPRMIVVKPFDPSFLSAIEKAILAANIGVTPLNDGKIIRLPIPELSEERRKELAKIANRLGEEARVAIRSVRRDANDALRELEKKKEIGEDELHRTLEGMQKTTDGFIKKIDDLVAAKSADIMSV